MLKLNRLLLAADANTGGDSSQSPDVKEQASSPVEQAEEQVEESTEETQDDASPSEEAATEETTEEQTPEEQTETEEVVEAEKTIDKPEDEKIPFNTHPRFKELVQEKNQYKQEVEITKPLAEQAKVTNEFLRDNQITPQEYQSALQYLMLLRKDPVQAFKMLQPTYEQLATLSGERLPADLQAKVASGILSNEDAVELSKARAQQTYAQWRGQQQQTAGQQSQVELVGSTIGTWASTKQSIDPDFKPGSPLWEQVDLRIKSMPVFRTPQEAMAGSEKAYTEAKAFMTKFSPRTTPAVKPALKSRPANSANHVVLKTADDVMNAIKAGVKPHQMRYS